MAAIWVVGHDAKMKAVLTVVLSEDGHEIRGFDRGDEVIEALADAAPSMVIVDIELPDGDGLRVCHALRESPGLDAVPVLVVAGSGRLEDRYRALLAGADDFLPKPFDCFEFLLRVRHCLKRSQVGRRQLPERLQVGDIDLDLASQGAMVGGRGIRLTPSEFRILKYLMERRGKPVDTQTLLSEALGYADGMATLQVLRTHVRNLRTKLEEDPAAPQRIVNFPGVGYMVKEAH